MKLEEALKEAEFVLEKHEYSAVSPANLAQTLGMLVRAIEGDERLYTVSGSKNSAAN